MADKQKPANEYNWKTDLGRFLRMLFHFGPMWLVPVLVLAGGLLLPYVPGCKPKSRVVVIYASQDQVYAEPILADFTKETGIKVLPLYDSEAVKTVGLANRLLAERSHPQCDVFWSNEELRTRQL